MNYFTLIINSGRSGSTFLEHLLKANYDQQIYIAHEDIPVQISKPKLYNRAYTKEQINVLLEDKELMGFVNKWKEILKTQSIVETGWTSSHLCPLLYHIFGDQFRCVIMHRDPISFAFSRANMGNYHINTFYTNHHEVSPFDKFSIAPKKRDIWLSMNHFEKCMYWWYIVYKEGFEFKEKFPQIQFLEIQSKDVFSLKRINEVLHFLGLDVNLLKEKDVPRNELPKFMKETFPVKNEWTNYDKHSDILKFAKDLGYDFEHKKIEKLSFKYKLSPGYGAIIRHKINYWINKNKFKNLILRKKY